MPSDDSIKAVGGAAGVGGVIWFILAAIYGIGTGLVSVIAISIFGLLLSGLMIMFALVEVRPVNRSHGDLNLKPLNEERPNGRRNSG